MLKKQIVDLTTKLINIESIKEKPDKLDEILDVIKNELSDYYYHEFSKDNIKRILAWLDDERHPVMMILEPNAS
jgi:uncharacterized protein (DUF2164 family)